MSSKADEIPGVFWEHHVEFMYVRVGHALGAHPLAWPNLSLMKVWINYHYLQLAWAGWTYLQFKRRAINSAQLLPSDIPTQKTVETHTEGSLTFCHHTCKIWYDSAQMPTIHVLLTFTSSQKCATHKSAVFSWQKEVLAISSNWLSLVMHFHKFILVLAHVALS